MPPHLGPVELAILLAFTLTLGLGLILVLVIVGLVKSVRMVSGGKSQALEILEERYARGEISKEEYEQKRRDLGR